VTPEIHLPRNVEAEAALIGAMLIENKIIDSLPSALSVAHFYEPLHGRLFERIVSLFNEGKGVTAVTLKPFFENDEAMKEVGGIGYLAQLTGSGAGLIGAKDFAKQIIDLAILREVISVSRTLIESATDTSESIDPESLLDEAQSALEKINGTEADSKMAFSADACVDEVIAEWDQPSAGVACGCIPELDRALGKIRPTELVIVAGRPGSGKTALAVSYANGVARNALDPEDAGGGGVLFISHEMSALELGGRLIADTAAYSNPIDYSKIANGWLNAEERERITKLRNQMRKLPLEVIQTPTLTIPRLRGLVRRWKRIFEKRGVPMRLLVVDYLQLMSGSKKGRDENRTAEISEISRGLKQIAMDEQLGVLALSQLSRAVEQREDKRPRLSDLRESGSIEQDANKVVGLYSALYYHEQTKPSPGSPNFETKLFEWEADRAAIKDQIEMIILKRRNGASGITVNGSFLREYQAVRGLNSNQTR